MAKKKPQNSELPRKTRKETAISGQQKVSEYEKIFMQVLRSQRFSLREIADLTGYCRTTISTYTEDTRFPKGTDLNISIMLRQLTMKVALDAWKDKGINKREYALTIEKYIGALKGIEDLRVNITLRDEILTIEHMMKEEDYSEEVLERLQIRYDKLNKELIGR